MEKENLVLVHSFPTNSILLSGLVDYLSDHYQVYFIDLPGFIKGEPSLEKISFAGYVRFVEDRLEALNLDHYVAEGISFGFPIINQVNHHGKCRGIIALEPFLGAGSLRMEPAQLALYSFGIQLVCSLKLYSMFWKSPLFASFLPKLAQFPRETIEIIFEQIDGRTFFETANLIFRDRSEYRYHDLPYILLANKADRTIRYERVHQELSEAVKKLLVINIEVEHYPSDISKEYFQEMVPDHVFQQISDFFNEEI